MDIFWNHTFSIFHTVILDLKAPYLLLVKLDDENFQLGKRGIEVECCFICKALRVCVLIYKHIIYRVSSYILLAKVSYMLIIQLNPDNSNLQWKSKKV